jgi:GntR family transcriptional regulator/MocR family aminotransferase
LIAEGFAEAKSGSGTYVAEGVGTVKPRLSVSPPKLRFSRFGAAAAAVGAQIKLSDARKPALRYDFAFGQSDLETFPFEMWRRILLRCARKASVSELDYGPAEGKVGLREAICTHLQRSRAVNCSPEQVIVVSGSQQALDLIARVLIEPGDKVAIEDPSYRGTSEVLRVAGARIVSKTVDREGLDPSHLPPDARIVFVTPSHQFPTGVVLPLARRLELLEWAKRCNSVIVEDDYDGEFRYEGQPLESLQGLDREGRVLYIGTFSRTIFPALRIGYLILPVALVGAFTAAKWLADRHTASLEQSALAEFIVSGMYERYLHRVRRRNTSRRKALLQAITTHLGNRVAVTGDGAGAHVTLWPTERVDEKAVVAGAASLGVGICGISSYFNKQPDRCGLILGYSRMKETAIREGIQRLAQVL